MQKYLSCLVTGIPRCLRLSTLLKIKYPELNRPEIHAENCDISKRKMVVDLVSHNEEEGKIEFHLDALSELLEPHKEKLISVISISGAFRTGKSFLQNWVLKYLECGSAESFSEFLQNEENAEETLSGFKSIRTRDPVTDGIDIFSEIFEFEHSVHGAVVVVVLDTQGIFSMNSDYAESVAIFAISLLLSSMQLYNIRFQYIFLKLCFIHISLSGEI